MSLSNKTIEKKTNNRNHADLTATGKRDYIQIMGDTVSDWRQRSDTSFIMQPCFISLCPMLSKIKKIFPFAVFFLSTVSAIYAK